MSAFMIKANIKNIDLEFSTSDTVFSPFSIDKGTLAMLSEVNFSSNDTVLDLGCGYGVVGILAAKLIGSDRVVMSDVSEDAVKLANDNSKINALENIKIVQSDGFDNITERDFSIILSNPPYHTDFFVAKGFIEGSFNHLVLGGKLLMVTKRFDWYKNKISSVFGGCRIVEKD